MARFSNSNVAVDDYPRQRDRSPDYLYAGGAAPSSPGAGGPYMTGPTAAPPGYSASTQALPRYRDDPSPPRPTTQHQSRDQQSLQIPHWGDRYRPRSVPPPMSPTATEASAIVFPPPRSHSRNYDRDCESYRDLDRRRENKGRQRERYHDSDHSSDDDWSNKPGINRSRTPLSKARHVLGSTFSDSTSGIGVGVLGAIVGGLAAREASENLGGKGGHGNGHQHGGREALFSTIVGAAVGGLGANAIGKRVEASRRKSGSGSSTSSPKAGDGEKNYTWGEKGVNKALEERKSSSGRDRDRDTYRERDMREKERDVREKERDRERRDSGTGRSQRAGGKDDYYRNDSDDEIIYDHRKRSPRERSRSRRDDDYRGGR